MKNNKAKIYMIFSLVVLVIAVIVSGTYAYYVWTTSDSDTTKIVAGIGAATVTFDGGSDISANLRPVSDKSKGIVKNISVKVDTAGLVFNMYLDITSIDTGLKDESFRYELYKETTKVKEGNFSDSYLTSNTVTCTKNNTNHIVLLTNESISTSKTSYTLYIWIDGANYTNPNTMMNKTFSFKLHADGEGAVLLSKADATLKQLNALNPSIAVDTSKIPDFSTVSGNSGVKVNQSDNTRTEGQGDGTKGIYVSEDDFGTSYYFRGAVENNYVKFGKYKNDLYYGYDSNNKFGIGANCNKKCNKLASAGDDMYWRIIRINGDGSIRMIYAGTEAYANGSENQSTSYIMGESFYNNVAFDNAYVGYMYGTVDSSSYKETHKNTNNSTIKTYIDNWYKTYLNSYTDYLQDTIYCNDRSVTPVSSFSGMELTGNGTGTTLTAYSDFTRNYVNNPATPNLKCTNMTDRFTVNTSNGNGALTYPIGLITADEAILGGGNTGGLGYIISNPDNYLFTNYAYWFMTPGAYFDNSAIVSMFFLGRIVFIPANSHFSEALNVIRPVISLRPDVIIGGDGTMNNPFVVE